MDVYISFNISLFFIFCLELKFKIPVIQVIYSHPPVSGALHLQPFARIKLHWRLLHIYETNVFILNELNIDHDEEIRFVSFAEGLLLCFLFYLLGILLN